MKAGALGEEWLVMINYGGRITRRFSAETIELCLRARVTNDPRNDIVFLRDHTREWAESGGRCTYHDANYGVADNDATDETDARE